MEIDCWTRYLSAALGQAHSSSLREWSLACSEYFVDGENNVQQLSSLRGRPSFFFGLPDFVVVVVFGLCSSLFSFLSSLSFLSVSFVSLVCSSKSLLLLPSISELKISSLDEFDELLRSFVVHDAPPLLFSLLALFRYLCFLRCPQNYLYSGCPLNRERNRTEIIPVALVNDLPSCYSLCLFTARFACSFSCRVDSTVSSRRLAGKWRLILPFPHLPTTTGGTRLLGLRVFLRDLTRLATLFLKNPIISLSCSSFFIANSQRCQSTD